MPVAYPLLWLSVAFLGGIVLEDAMHVSRGSTLLVTAIATFAVAMLLAWRFKRRRLAWGLMVAGAALIGMARFALSQPDFGNLHFIGTYANAGRPAKVVGRLVEPPDRRPTYVNLVIETEYIRFGNQQAIPVHGRVLVHISPEQASHLQYGDRVVAFGYLDTPHDKGLFPYRSYLARHGIFVELKPLSFGVLARGGNSIPRLLYAFRSHAHTVVRQIWHGASGALLAGILLGLDKGIPQEVYAAFRRTGTAHIIAISGFNIAILAGVFVALFGRLFGERKGILMAALAISAYTVLVGADAAVVRAAIMGLVGMLALQVGRRQHAYTTLAFTAAVMASLNPNVLWDVGFQLSFAATWGLMRFALPMQKGVESLLGTHLSSEKAARVSKLIGEFFLFTVAAQAVTWPISAYHFHQVSLVALLANPAILPVQAPLMISGGIATLLGLVWLPLGKVVGLFVSPLAAYTIRAVQWFSGLPFTTASTLSFRFGYVVLYYVVLLGGIFIWERREAISLPKFAIPKTAALLGMALIVSLEWSPILQRPDGRLQVSILPVGNGEAILIRSPTGAYALLNGGENSAEALAALGKRLRGFAAVPSWLIVGCIDEESTAALPDVLKAYHPHAVWWAGEPGRSPAARRVMRQLHESHIPVWKVKAGAALNFGDGARLSAIAVFQRGAAFTLQWRHFRMLIPVGVDSLKQLQGFTPQLRPLSAMLLAHSGRANANPPQTIRAWEPRLLLLSVRPNDRHGLPSLELLQALQDLTILRTDLCGEIHIATDGYRMWVRTSQRCNSFVVEPPN